GVVDVHGGVHILVNNAGVTVTASFEDHSLEDWEWIMGINFWGVLHGCKLFLPHLKAADEAHIVNLSSLFGLQGMPLQTSYCASKFAVRGLSESLWIELRQHGIGVTSVHPGGVRTSIARSARVVGDEAEQDKSTAIALIDNSRVSPEQCAKMIVGAIKRNKPRLLVAPETHLIESLKRLAPTLPLRLIESGYARGMHRRGGS
ncbi:MAG: SDR family NAD(P)-dependent oxidoreductase, partial [Myxococcales bacterium]